MAIGIHLKKTLPEVLAGFVVLFGCVTLFFLDPVRTRFFPRCLFRMLTGLQCPGCGFARAMYAALHGRFAEAFHYNMALPAMLLLLALAVFVPSLARNPVFACLLVAFFLAWGVARNLLGV